MAIFEIQGWYGCQFLVAMFDPIIDPSSRISATTPLRELLHDRGGIVKLTYSGVSTF